MNENRTTVVLLGIVAFLLLGVLYYYVIYPKSETRARTENSVEQLKGEITALENRVDVLGVTDEVEDDYELRKKLPKSRELDSLLHSIHGIELVSDAEIVSINFNHYDEEVWQSTNLTPAQREEEVIAEEETAEEVEVDEAGQMEEEEEEEEPVTEIDLDRLPKQLKLLSLELDVAVPDEEHVLTFLQEIEVLERVVRIDRVEFLQPGEEQLTEQNPDERVFVTVQLTTFYAEEVEK